jgi:hypothetical protein
MGGEVDGVAFAFTVPHASFDLLYRVHGSMAKDCDRFTAVLNVSGECSFIRNTGKVAGTEMDDYFAGMRRRDL